MIKTPRRINKLLFLIERKKWNKLGSNKVSGELGPKASIKNLHFWHSISGFPEYPGGQ